MSHEFESGMFSNNEAAWHGLGNVLPYKVYDTEEAIKLAGLDWTVSKHPIYVKDPDAEGGLVEVNGRRAIVRDSDNSILGTVSSRYEPLQNLEAFKFFDPFLHEKEAFISSAISLSNGRRIAVVAEIEDNERTVVKDDKVKSYLLFSTSHDASLSSSIRFTTVRVVCANTLAVAMMQNDNVRSVRHCRTQSERLAEIQHTVNLYKSKFEEEVNIYKTLASKPMDDYSFRGYLEKLFEKDLERRGKDLGTDDVSLEDIRAGKHCLNYFMYTEDLQMDGVRDTAWAGYNAVTEYIKNKSSDRNKRMEAIWYGPDAALLERAKHLALAA